MGNKSTFTVITLIVVLVIGFLFYEEKVTQLKNEITAITQEYNEKITLAQSGSSNTDNAAITQQHNQKTELTRSESSLGNIGNQQHNQKTELTQSESSLGNIGNQQHNQKTKLTQSESNLSNTQSNTTVSKNNAHHKNKADNSTQVATSTSIDRTTTQPAPKAIIQQSKPSTPLPATQTQSSISALESLNNQLIKTQSALRVSEQKLLRANSKAKVLTDEIKQIKDSRTKVRQLESSVNDSKQKLALSEKKLKYLSGILEDQNEIIIEKNLERIAVLKSASSGIALTGAIVPAVGIATLVSYTVEEIRNYCQNIENIITLEEGMFGRAISLNDQARLDYQNQCLVSLTDQIKQNLEL